MFQCWRSCWACLSLWKSFWFCSGAVKQDHYLAPVVLSAQAFTIFLLHCCLLSLLPEIPHSWCVYLPSGGCCRCCVTPAASLTHKEELGRRGGVVNMWSQGISRKQPALLCTAPANKWMRLPLCLSLGPSCCCGIQEVGLGDRSFIVT